MIVRKILPESALRAVVLPHGAPAAFAKIGAPAFPIVFPGGVVRQALSLCRERGFCGILHGFLARQLAIFGYRPINSRRQVSGALTFCLSAMGPPDRLPRSRRPRGRRRTRQPISLHAQIRARVPAQYAYGLPSRPR